MVSLAACHILYVRYYTAVGRDVLSYTVPIVSWKSMVHSRVCFLILIYGTGSSFRSGLCYFTRVGADGSKSHFLVRGLEGFYVGLLEILGRDYSLELILDTFV